MKPHFFPSGCVFQSNMIDLSDESWGTTVAIISERSKFSCLDAGNDKTKIKYAV